MVDMTAPSSTAPPIFKRYLVGGGVVYEVACLGRTISIHATLAEAQAALSNCASSA